MDLYQQRLMTEGIRVVENNKPVDSFAADYSNLGFDKALSTRTQLAELRYQVSPVIAHFQQLFKLFCSLMCLLFILLGATSVSQVLLSDSGTKINFFWAIILFIAPNILSLIIWLFLYFSPRTLNLSWVASLNILLIGLLDKLQHKYATHDIQYISLFQFYFKHHLSGGMGKVQLSFISHLWWSCYFIGATLSLLLVLATHQVDFIWQTTILNENTFLQFTQWLTYLPNTFMLNVPSANDVRLASIDIANSLEAAQSIRVSWSNLLIFSLMVYALLPRLILTVLFYYRTKSVQKSFMLDLSLPYYVQLKSMLHPNTSKSFITDPDLMEPQVAERDTNLQGYNRALLIPDKSFPFAIELKPEYEVKAASLAAAYFPNKLINVLDAQTQEAALSAFYTSQLDNLILYVDVMRLPDRGWLSLVKKCQENNHVSILLILLGASELDDAKLKRIQDWMEMAAQVNISPQNITYIANTQQAHSTDINEEGADE